MNAPAISMTIAMTLWIASPAYAYKYNTCGGEKVVWDDPIRLYQNMFSIPGLSLQEGAFNNALKQWNTVGGMKDVMYIGGGTYASSIEHGDGFNDVALVNRSDIDGKNGRTLRFTDGCFLAGDEEFVEADIMVANDMPMSNPDETDLEKGGRVTFLHEFGHALGLEHYQSADIMRSSPPRPLTGGPGEHVDVLADDADGGRFLYPSGKPELNLYATAQRLENGVITNDNGVTPQLACRGGTFWIWFTVGNNGNISVRNNQSFFLSKSKTGYTGGTLMAVWSGATNVPGVFNGTINVAVPNVPPGTYFVFFGVDKDNKNSESREDDNVARLNHVLIVLDC